MTGRDGAGEAARQERFYLVVGIAGLGLLLASLALRYQTLTLAALLVHVVGAVVVAAWAVSGAAAARRRAREEAAAAERAAREREAREARQRAVAQIKAKRTVSYGGMTINVHRRAADASTKASGDSAARSGEQAR